MTTEASNKLRIILGMYKIDGKPALEVITDGQFEIIYHLVFRVHKRIHIMTSTQYGKSRAVALACHIITCIMGEKAAVVAPTNDKFKIIMRYYRDHFKDQRAFEALLEKDSKLERLIMEETAKRITLKNGATMFGISAQAGNGTKGIEAAMGEGAPNIIMDEASLIPDVIEATLFRMIAGQGTKGFYCKIGNPFYRNHFLKSYEDKNYYKIDIDYTRAVKEGRYTKEFIQEAEKKPMFNVLFKNKFPGEEAYDEGLFLQLLPPSRISVRPDLGIPFLGQKVMGIDPAGEGKNTTRFCVRDGFQARIVATLNDANSKLIVQTALTLLSDNPYKDIAPKDIVVDSFGVGADVGKDFALATKGKMNVYTVLVGNRPKAEEEYNGYFFRRKANEHDQKDDIYMNLRALGYFRMREWFMKGGYLISDDGDNSAWKTEISVIKYRRAVQGNVIQIMSKKEMMARGIMSPDMADALMLTFLRNIDENPQTPEEIEEALRASQSDFDPHSVF